MTLTMTLHAFYSNKQSQFGTFIYETIDGKEIEVTEVASTSTYPSNWDDVIYLGEVTKYIRNFRNHNIKFNWNRCNEELVI